jgi:hypothetical protein
MQLHVLVLFEVLVPWIAPPDGPCGNLTAQLAVTIVMLHAQSCLAVCQTLSAHTRPAALG